MMDSIFENMIQWCANALVTFFDSEVGHYCLALLIIVTVFNIFLALIGSRRRYF